MARKKLHEISIQDDIRYRGPLSYQGFQVLGWLCIVLSVVWSILTFGGKMDPELAKSTESLVTVLSFIASLSLPFLLIANFSKILNNDEGYAKQLLMNGAVAAAIFAVSAIFFSRYVVSAIGKLTTDPEDVLPLMMKLFRGQNENGFIAFNLFIDLFLCTLFMFFLNARPKRVFTGKKVLVLRVLALLPIAYEAASWIIKWKAATGEITVPFWVFPLLTVKPPVTFAVFVLLALHVKGRELRFCRKGRTHEEYLAFLKTRRNSLHFSIYLAVVMAIAAIVDLILLIVMMSVSAGSMEALANSTAQDELMKLTRVGSAIGFGEGIMLIFVSPVMLLYSYTREPKNKKISMLIPVVGITLIILIVIESAYRALDYLPIERVNLTELIQTLKTLAETPV